MYSFFGRVSAILTPPGAAGTDQDETWGLTAYSSLGGGIDA